MFHNFGADNINEEEEKEEEEEAQFDVDLIESYRKYVLVSLPLSFVSSLVGNSPGFGLIVNVISATEEPAWHVKTPASLKVTSRIRKAPFFETLYLRDFSK